MAGRKKAPAHSSNASQTSITNWLSSTPRAKPSGKQAGDTAQAVQGAPKWLAATGPHSNTPRRMPTVSFGSSNLSSPPPEEISSPLRRSSRIRATATPVPAPALTPKKPTRKFVRQTPPQMPQGIKGPSPLRDKPRRTSPSYYWTAEGYRDPSDTDEVPSSQKDDTEYIDDDIETLESIPIFHMSSLPSSPSSDGGAPTPAVSTPPAPLSPESKTRNIIAEIRAKALLAASSNSPPLKRSLSPSDDSDSDALPDAGFFFGNKAHPNKRRASTTPSPTQVRHSARKSKLSPVVLLPTPKASKPKPAPIPFAALLRERDARAKREESLPRAPDGSRQDIFAIANAALLRDPDATFEDVGAEGGSQDATAALNQLAEGGFAAEAEMVRRAGTTPEVLGWTVFTPREEVKGELLPRFPQDIGASLKTKKAVRTWEWISERMNAQDYARVAGILDSNLVDLAFSDPQEHGVVEPLIRWLVELVTVSPPAFAFARGASHQASLLLRHLDSEAQDRIALHIAQCMLRVGIPGDGVLLAHSILGPSSESYQTSFAVPSEEQRRDRILSCVSMLKCTTRAKDVFPVLSVLCILGVDPTLDVSTRCDIAEAAELWACKSESTEAQLDICSRLANALADLPIQQKRDLVLRVLRGTRPIGVQLTMWLATAFLDGMGLKGVTPQMYRARPPLERILDYTLTFHITYETNYSDLLATAQLLDIALWDVAALVDTERNEGKIVKYQPGVPVNSMVTDVINKLAEVHGRILDARAADLERTRTKAYLQTLQVRLGWDLIEAARSGQKTAKTIKEMWGRPRPAVA